MTALLVNQLYAGYEKMAVLHDVTVHVDVGELVALVGANGAGKTTLLRAASGLLMPTSGKVEIFGDDVTGWPAERLASHGVAHVPQNRLVFPGLSVADNLALGAYTRRREDPGAVATDRDYVFDLFPVLADRRRQRAGTLSGGEQQMLAIGRALMAHPRLLLLDEPSLGLAPMLVREILVALVRLRTQQSLSILLIEQNARAALAISDRAYVFERGTVVREGVSSQLAADPAIQEAYLGGGDARPDADAETDSAATGGIPS